MGQEAMANAAIVNATDSNPTVMQDSFGQPELTASAALVEVQPKTRSLDPFVTSTKNTNLNQLINKYAALYDVPESLVHHVVRRETNYNPSAVHRGNWGLMQIRYNTARGLGYQGSPTGLLDAETNLKYAVKYLKGAWVVAEKDAKKADWLYRTGYYYEAKRKDLLDDLDMK
jgi:soluble lytic murein transglycosylase-like protein